MSHPTYPVAITAEQAPPRSKPTNYPEPFASRMAGRDKRALGDLFGLTNFGVNLTRLAPNAISALRHAHTRQDEFVYILQGRPTLHTGEEVVYLEVGDRTPGDEGSYPDDDLQAALVEGKWKFVHKNGAPYR